MSTISKSATVTITFSKFLIYYEFFLSVKRNVIISKKMMPTCQRANVPYLLTCLRAHVPTCLVCLGAHVSTCFPSSLANVPSVLTYLRAHVLCILICSCSNVSSVPKCYRAITSNSKNKFSVTYFI